jgi:hypothetical protein
VFKNSYIRHAKAPKHISASNLNWNLRNGRQEKEQILKCSKT